MAYDPDGTFFQGCAYSGICEDGGPLHVDAVTCSFHDPLGYLAGTGNYPNPADGFIIVDLGTTSRFDGVWGTYFGFADFIATVQPNPGLPIGRWFGQARTNWSTVGFGQPNSPTPGETTTDAVITILAPGMTILNNPGGDLSNCMGFPATYTDPVTTSCGTAPFIYTVTSGNLPPGIILNADGSLSGVPQQSGSFEVCFGVTDFYGFTGNVCGILLVSLAPSEQWILHRFDMKPRKEGTA